MFCSKICLVGLKHPRCMKRAERPQKILAFLTLDAIASNFYFLHIVHKVCKLNDIELNIHKLPFAQNIKCDDVRVRYGT